MKVRPEQIRLLTLRDEKGKPTRALVLVRKYEKPDKITSNIWTAPAWRLDNSRALWEVVKSSDGADEVLGMALEPDWIVVTPPNHGVHRSDIALEPRREGEEAPSAWIIDAKEIVQIYQWDGEDDERTT